MKAANQRPLRSFWKQMRGNRDGADLDGDSPMDDTEGRIREKLDGEFKEE